MTTPQQQASRAAATRQRAAAREKVCVEDDCDRKQKGGGGGLCASHYRRKLGQQTGAVLDKRRGSPAWRFARRVDRSGSDDDCWPWMAGLNRYGYGLFRVSTGYQLAAHAYAWGQEHGPVPDGMVLDHTCHPIDGSCEGGPGCEHRRCCNPAHMVVTTRGANSARRVGRREFVGVTGGPTRSA